MADWNIFDETISSDLFTNMLERIEDKLMEQGSLSGLLGNEYSFSLSVTRESEEIIVTINLFPENEVKLTADELDSIGDLAISKVQAGLLKGTMNKSQISEDECSIISNVLIHGERPNPL